MLSVKAREAADTVFKVFVITQLRIKPNLPRFAGERSNHYILGMTNTFDDLHNVLSSV